MTGSIQLQINAYRRLEGSTKPVRVEWSEIVDPTKPAVNSIRSQVSKTLMGLITLNADYSFTPEVNRAKSQSRSAIVAKVIEKDANGITIQRKASQSGTGVPIEERRLKRLS